MRFGVNTFLFDSPFTDETVSHFPKIKEMGFDGVEVSYENLGDFDAKVVRTALQDNGLECSSVCGAYGAGRDLRGTPAEQEGAKQYIRNCIDGCYDLGCEIFCGPHYSRVGRSSMESQENRKRQWELVVKNLREVCQYAGDKGVYLTLEPLNRFETDFLNIAADAIRLIRDVGSPMLKVHLDTFHMNIEEKSMLNAISESGELLYHFHASESDRGAPGTGLVDWKTVKDALNSVHYDRWMVIESFTPAVEIIAKAASIYRTTEQSSEALCKKGLDFLHALFAK